jgi:hypothetical protein
LAWSKDVTKEYPIKNFPYGAVMDVRFNCLKCGRELEVCSLSVGMRDTEDKRRNWEPTERVECFCSETYCVIAENSIAGWLVKFENIHDLAPKTFQYRITRYCEEMPADLFIYYMGGINIGGVDFP